MMFFCQRIDYTYELYFDKLSSFGHNICAKGIDLGVATFFQLLYLSLVPLTQKLLPLSATFLWQIFNLTYS